MTPLISVIMASYNKAGLIGDTIASVLGQSYQNWELIIVDDCSTDGSMAVIRDLTRDQRIKTEQNDRNRGANHCRNRGIALSKGEYILFLDADDLLAERCIESRVMAASKHADANLLIFTMGVFYKTIGDDQRRWNPLSKNPLVDFLQHDLPWSILQPLWKKEFLAGLGGFDEQFQRLQDVELNTRALLDTGIRCKQFPGEPDCYYRIDESRKNFDPAALMGRWVKSALRYYDKFYTPAKERGCERYLFGTIYRTYLQLVYQYKTSALTSDQFILLEEQLLNRSVLRELGFFKALVFKACKKANLLPVRLPGLNRIMNELVIL